MILLALLGSFLFSVANRLTTKHCSNIVSYEPNTAAYPLFLIVNCALSCIFYYCSGDGTLPLNRTTLLFSVGYGIISLSALLISLTVYRFFTIANVTVSGSIGSMILTVLFGILLFSEKLSTVLVLKCLLMVVALWFSVRSAQKGAAFNWKHLYILLAMPVVSSSASLLAKAYVSAPDACGNASFCFFTNVVVIIAALIWLLVIRCKNRETPMALNFGKRQFFSTTLIVVINGGSQLISLYLLSKMAVSMLTPVTAALGLMAGAVSSLLYREKLNRFSLIAIGLSLIAVVL